MQELRDFELDGSGRPVGWRAGAGQRIVAREGRIWLTVEGDSRDVWLRPGDEHALPDGAMVWLSGESSGARFTLVQPARLLLLRRLLACLHRRARPEAPCRQEPEAGWWPAR